MANTTRVTLTYSDFGGKRWSFSVYVSDTVVTPDDAVITGLIAALNACIHPINLRVEISRSAAYAGVQSAQAYPTVNDKALMVITDVNGDPHTWQIPGPADELIAADRRGVITTPGSEGKAWVDVVLANFQGRGGQSLGEFVKGYRKTSRRINKE